MSRQRDVRRADVAPGTAGADHLLDLLPAALAGDGPALAIAPAGDDPASVRAQRAVLPDASLLVDDDVAVVLATSGSTGGPRGVLLTAAALLASGEAALTALVGGAAAWSLCLPVTSAGGLAVLVRSLMSSTEPEVVPSIGGASRFTAAQFAEATWRLDPSLPACTSLVPTQAALLLDDEEGLAALRAYDAVLIGAARTPSALLERLRAAQVAAVPTYGMTETCGGLVYDGVPLPGAGVRIGETGRIELSGPMLARGYLGGGMDVADGWLRTQDAGRLVDGRLEVLGRLDDVVQVGGVNVAVGAVQDVLAAHCADAVVLADPDERWGARLTAYVVLAATSAGGADVVPDAVHAVDPVDAGADVVPDAVHAFDPVDAGADVVPDAVVETLSAAVTAQLGRAAVPRTWVRLAAVPLLPNGKPDRIALREIVR
ncbi:MAG: AMP-binding protein [Candidatus Nanopelagicales bacterium]